MYVRSCLCVDCSLEVSLVSGAHLVRSTSVGLVYQLRYRDGCYLFLCYIYDRVRFVEHRGYMYLIQMA